MPGTTGPGLRRGYAHGSRPADCKLPSSQHPLLPVGGHMNTLRQRLTETNPEGLIVTRNDGSRWRVGPGGVLQPMEGHVGYTIEELRACRSTAPTSAR